MAFYITGGSGYIGTHLANLLRLTGEQIIILDNQSGQNKFPIIKTVKYVHLSLNEDHAQKTLEAHFKQTKSNYVIHLAGLKSVEISVTEPAVYSQNNLKSTINLLAAMEHASVDKLIFSSSAAVYGNRLRYVDEKSPVKPISQYGKIKLLEEELIHKAGNKFLSSYAILRFFNVVGAENIAMRENFGGNIFPQLTKAIQERKQFKIYGNKYATVDGTCIRDYVDVRDLASGILNTLELLNNSPLGIFNLGSGLETSVLQVVEKVLQFTEFDYLIGPPRKGDISSLVANITKSNKILKWSTRFSLDESIYSSFAT